MNYKLICHNNTSPHGIMYLLRDVPGEMLLSSFQMVVRKELDNFNDFELLTENDKTIFRGNRNLMIRAIVKHLLENNIVSY